MKIVNLLVRVGRLDNGADGADLTVTVEGKLPADDMLAAKAIAHALLDPQQVHVVEAIGQADGNSGDIELFRNHLN